LRPHRPQRPCLRGRHPPRARVPAVVAPRQRIPRRRNPGTPLPTGPPRQRAPAQPTPRAHRNLTPRAGLARGSPTAIARATLVQDIKPRVLRERLKLPPLGRRRKLRPVPTISPRRSLSHSLQRPPQRLPMTPRQRAARPPKEAPSPARMSRAILPPSIPLPIPYRPRWRSSRTRWAAYWPALRQPFRHRQHRPPPRRPRVAPRRRTAASPSAPAAPSTPCSDRVSGTIRTVPRRLPIRRRDRRRQSLQRQRQPQPPRRSPPRS
jgi:hypothetical protein